jgi:hypothetical protein
MNSSNILKLLVILGLVFTSCKNLKKSELESNKITLEKLKDSPSYSDAALKSSQLDSTFYFYNTDINFNFDIENYNLGVQTESENAKILANSGKGQHIHFILNNQPYSAHYESNFKKNIPKGSHHLVAFLSRSYHESVKNKNSVFVKNLIVGETYKDSIAPDMNAPTLIYSRPKGNYSGKDTEQVLLDFFVLNTSLSEQGNKVKATINDQEFLITEWVPHVMKGLPLGEVTIKLELIDSSGIVISGPYNSVTRTVTFTD